VNPRIFVGAAVGALVVILILFGFSGSVSDIGKGGFLTPSTEEQIIYPVEIVLHDLTVLEVSEKEATLEVKFKISNPNFKSVMLQHIKYLIYHNDLQIEVGEIGTSPEGFLASPNYFLILNERPSIIGEKFTIKNSGNNPELWEALSKNALNWRVTGDAFFNLSSLTAGQENIIAFDISKQD
tara:strand:- start:1917 stop:2462 length:546 start_codon:yes stop_codon:yes gene_type:complete